MLSQQGVAGILYGKKTRRRPPKSESAGEAEPSAAYLHIQFKPDGYRHHNAFIARSKQFFMLLPSVPYLRQKVFSPSLFYIKNNGGGGEDG